MHKLTLEFSQETVEVVRAAIADNGQSPEDFIQDLVNKTCVQKKVAFARQRLNIGKKLIAQLVAKKVKGYESLEGAYQNQGMSADVETYGGIRKVFEDLYQKSGLHIDATRIRINNVVAVNESK
jgi:hypothetical protein